MLSVEQITDWIGRDVLDADGESLGKLDDIYFGPDGQAELAVVKHGLLGRKQMIVPLAEASVSRDYVRIAHSAATVEQANEGSTADAGERFDGADAQLLGQAYGMQIAATDLESVNAQRAREAAAREAEERAARLEADANEQAEAARDTQALADERADQAASAQQAAQSARKEADELDP